MDTSVVDLLNQSARTDPGTVVKDRTAQRMSLSQVFQFALEPACLRERIVAAR